ncbi:hypothetical protein BSL78_14148 [Apostichopus japonicus]|uniref:Uncharacterized protein n=1 Tax=Stichopus japonicus TaxID=307972 RepID=A0A2G8KLZ7_STIJA|nr:hypothetical protein BSL78_14148 [Apostichopus japonicus]
MKLFTLVTIFLSYEVFAAIPLGIPLTVEQLKEIERNQGIIRNIKQNYFKNRKYYSHLPPIIHLTEEQEAEILEHYRHFFRAFPPETLSSYVFNGTEYGADPDPYASAPVGFEAVCPSTSVYEDILFTVNDINEVLQMIQMESFEQWVLNETCDSTSGNVVGTVCLERERLIDAVVINLETSDTTFEQIKVFCCSAYSDIS